MCLFNLPICVVSQEERRYHVSNNEHGGKTRKHLSLSGHSGSTADDESPEQFKYEQDLAASDANITTQKNNYKEQVIHNSAADREHRWYNWKLECEAGAYAPA